MKKTLIMTGTAFFVFLILIIGILGGSGGNSCEAIDTNSPANGSNGDWTKKDSQVYKDMSYAAKIFKNDLGLSGNQISAVLAIGYKESGFNPKSVNPSGEVKGIFQWGYGTTNGNRYKDTQDNVVSQMNLVKKELKSTHSFVHVKLLKANSIAEAEQIWSTGYEGLPENDTEQRKTAQVLADAQSIKNALKLDFASSGVHSELGQDANENEKNNNEMMTDSSNALDCDNRGSVNGQNSGAPVDKVPKKWVDKVKFDNNRSVTYADNKYPFGQCTYYVYNRMKQTGTFIEWFSGDSGNGANWGEAAMRAGGYSVKKDKPEVGTAVSFKGGQYGSVAPYGHIAFVEAVADDGSFLVSEANVINSGTGQVSFREFKSGKGLTFITGK